MDFIATEQQQRVQEIAREFAQQTLAPDARRLDREGGFPRQSLKRAAELGLLGIGVPSELGGMDAGTVAYSLAVSETARVCAATTVAMCVSNMVAEVIAAFGTSEQRTQHVPALCKGEYVVGAFALSESGAGSDPGGMLTRARKTERGWVLEGSKLWITSGTDAGLFVVWARTSDAPGARGISCFLVPGDAPGLVRGRPEHKMGLNGSTTTPLELHEVEVGPEALLGEENRGFRVAMMALDGGRVGIASQALGVAMAATEAARAHAVSGSGQLPVSVGEAGGGLAQTQAIQWLLADSATELDAARLLTLRAAWLKESGKPFTREASIAKVFATERAYAACDRALEVLGNAGGELRQQVERNFRDVRVTMIYEGTSEVQRIVISREIVRRFAEAA